MATLADIVIDLRGNTDPLNKDLKSGTSMFRSFAGTATKIVGGLAAVFGTLSFGNEIRKQFEQLDVIAKFGRQTGIATEAISGLGFAAEQSGGSQESMNASLERFQRRIGLANEGIGTLDRAMQGASVSSGAAKNVIKELGLDAAELASIPIDEAFGKVADVIAGMETPTEKAAAAFQFFGRQGQELLPLLNEGAEGIKRFQDEAADLGFTFDEAELLRIENANDAMNRISRTVQGIAGRVAVAIAPTVELFADGIRTVTSTISAFFREVANSTAVQSLVDLFGLLVDVARSAVSELLRPFSALMGAGAGANEMIRRAADAIGTFVEDNREAIVTALKFAGAIGGVLAVLGTLTTVIGSVGAALASVGSIGAVIFSPLVVAIAAATAATAAFIMLFGEGETMAEKLSSAVGKVVDGLQVAWTVVKQFGATFAAAFIAARDLALSVWDAIVSAATSAMSGVGASVAGTMQNVADWITDGLIVAEFGFKNAGDVAALWGSQVALAVTTMSNQITHFFTGVLPSLFTWFTENWTGLWQTALDFTLTVLINLGKNIRNVFAEIWDFVKSGGRGGFDVESLWTPLTEGARSALSELPEIPARQIGAMEEELAKNVERLKGSLGTGLSDFLEDRRAELQIDIAGTARPEIAGPETPAAGGGPGGGGGGPAAEVRQEAIEATDVRSVEGFKNLQSLITGSGAGVDQQILAEDKTQTKILADQKDESSKNQAQLVSLNKRMVRLQEEANRRGPGPEVVEI